MTPRGFTESIAPKPAVRTEHPAIVLLRRYQEQFKDWDSVSLAQQWEFESDVDDYLALMDGPTQADPESVSFDAVGSEQPTAVIPQSELEEVVFEYGDTVG